MQTALFEPNPADAGDPDSVRAEMVREAKQVCELSPRPFEFGKQLVELEMKYDRSVTEILREVAKKGRKRSKLTSFMKLYRVYWDFLSDEMNQLKDPVALRLADSILLPGDKLTRHSPPITDARCKMPRRDALDSALNGSAESLAILFRNNCMQVRAFGNETDIESWFDGVQGDFAGKHNLRPLAEQVAFGKALGAVDRVFYGDALGVLVLVELKDSVNFQDVGQALGPRSELVEHSIGIGATEMKTARLYPASRKRPRNVGSGAKYIRYSSVEVWLVGQVFDASAYYAAKGQTLSFFKITADKQIEGPVRAAHMTLDEWCAFAYGRRTNETCRRPSDSGELDLTAGPIEL